MSHANTPAPTRDPVAVAGLALVAAGAVILSFSALAGLGELVGFGGPGRAPLHWLIPVCVDAYGATATRIAVNGRYSAHTRRHALVHAAAAIVVSVLGNAAFHLIEARVLDLGYVMTVLVVAVSVVPPVALGALAHLMALCARDTAAARQAAGEQAANRPREAAGEACAEDVPEPALAQVRRAPAVPADEPERAELIAGDDPAAADRRRVLVEARRRGRLIQRRRASGSCHATGQYRRVPANTREQLRTVLKFLVLTGPAG
jgi:hypothetical protein